MRAYKVVDVFSATPLMGNPVAVVLDGKGLDTARMQAIARWTNLSETTFLLPRTDPTADYALRIFTPGGELPFAGHPTLGSAPAALEAGLAQPTGGELIQECGVGLVRIAVQGTAAERRLTFHLPAAKVTPLDAAQTAELEAVLGQPLSAGIVPAVVDVGAVWIVAQLTSAEAVLAAAPDFPRSIQLEQALGASGVSIFGVHSPGAGAAIEVRSFAASCGINEDPVCGSGNGAIAVFRFQRGLLPAAGGAYVAAQGRQVGRNGKVLVSVDADGAVRVGGACITTVEGTIRLGG